MTKALWWKQGPIYQIYPRSFFDANGDGVGDLEGIRRKLDYIAGLGATGIWLSPICPSPMVDFGYDISNYRDIDPLFGSLDDFKRLLRDAERRGIRIIMDMVLNHSSDRHPWFVESRAGRDSAKRDWYIWHGGRKGGRHCPNNWMGAFGGRAWKYDRETGEYYLHLFTEAQPDLNWRSRAMKKAMFDELRFWLDLGVKGFRLDVINYLVKDARFRNNPYRLRPTFPRRHDLQTHIMDRNQEETFGIVRELRALTDRYDETMLVGEVYPDEGVHDPALAGRFLGGGDDMLHLAFDFSPVYTPFRADRMERCLKSWYEKIPATGWPCHVLSNHDQSRAATRLGGGDDGINRLLALMLLTQRGTPFLYYGEEIGMIDGRLKRSELRDPVGVKYYPFHPGRDRSRTPMQWDDSPNGGFSAGTPAGSTAAGPWLPVNPDYRERNVAGAEGDPSSILHWYRDLIQIRKTYEALHSGEIEFLPNQHREVLMYERRAGNERLLGVLNFSRRPRTVSIPLPAGTLISTGRAKGSPCGKELTLAPLEAGLFRLLP
ncbi:MAG: alpha-glucosidase [Treponema sp.]|jgi:alpha-glucosidase|nr:alpha-glucosidase [Treponema sp.]